MIESASLKKLNKKLSDIGENLLKAAETAPNEVTRELIIGANDIRNTIIKSMRDTPKTGKIYRRGKKGRKHTASSAGNPPAIDYGELVRSIVYDAGNMEIEIGSRGGAPYAEYLEAGTKKMAARPWLEPAVVQHKDDIVAIIGQIVTESIGGAFE